MVVVVYTPHVMELGGMDWTTHIAAAETPGGTTGDSFANTGKELFIHINASGSNTKTVMFERIPCNYGTDHDPIYTTATSTTEVYGPFPVSQFGSSIAVTYAGTGGVTDVKALVVRVPFTN